MSRIPGALGLLAFLFLAPHLASAADKYWTGATSVDWGTNGNWTGNAPGANDVAVFNSTFTNQPDLSGNKTAGGIWMTGSVGQNVTVTSASSKVLTLNGTTINGTSGLGMLVDNANAFTLTINVAVKVNNAQTWRNNSGNLLTIGSGGVDMNNKALTIDGSGNTTIAGLVSGAGAFTKASSGTLTLSNTSNSFTGKLTVQSGALSIDTINNISSAGELGNNALSVTLGSSGATGTLRFTGASGSGSKTFTMATGGTGAFQVDLAGTTLTLSGLIDGAGALQKTGAGTLSLTGTNTYSGGTTINAGTVVINKESSLGAVGGALAINAGTLEVATGFSTSRNISLGSSASTIMVDPSQTYTVTTAITGSGSLNKTGGGTLIASASNTYSGGGTKVTAGTLKNGVANSLPTGTTLTVSNSGTYDLNGNAQTVAGLADGGTSTGVVTNSGSAATLTVNNTTTNSFSGTISGANLALTKTGSGTLTLSGSNTYAGATTVSSGKLIVTGSISGSLFTVQNGATLSGNGTTGAVTAQSGSTVAPGDVSTGILNTGNFVQNAGAAFTVRMGGITAGAQYDQLKVTGTVTLAGNLQRSLVNGFTPTHGDKFFIIINDGVDAVSGTFSGLAQGSTFSIGAYSFQISYVGDSGTNSFTGGNDVLLMAVPEPGVMYLVGCGALFLLRRVRRRLRS